MSITDMTCSCPEQAFHRGVGGICPLGHYCPEGSEVSIPCAAGYYADVEGQVLCTRCPVGFYCLLGATEYLSTPCASG